MRSGIDTTTFATFFAMPGAAREMRAQMMAASQILIAARQSRGVLWFTAELVRRRAGNVNSTRITCARRSGIYAYVFAR